VTKRRAIITVAIALLLASASAWSLLRPSETEVYAAVFLQSPEIRPLLTSKPFDCLGPGHVASIPDPLANNFREANARGAKPIPLTALSWQFDTVNPARLEGPGVIAAHQHAAAHGGALVYLSRVGFNAQHDEALFCALGAVGAEYIHLKLEHGEWREVGSDLVWIH